MNAEAYQIALGWESGKQAEILSKDICEFANKQLKKIDTDLMKPDNQQAQFGFNVAVRDIIKQKKEILKSLS